MEDKIVEKPKKLLESIKSQLSRIPRKWIPILVVLIALPVTLVLARTAQEIRSHAGGYDFTTIQVSPGAIHALFGEKIPLSALAYDSGNNPIFAVEDYSWSMSSTYTIGTLSQSTGKINEFHAVDVGCGIITVTGNWNGITVTKGIVVVVRTVDTIPDCSNQQSDTKAIKFNGLGHLNLMDPSSDSDLRDDFTIEAWIKVDPVFGAQNIVIRENQNTGSVPLYWFYAYYQPTKLKANLSFQVPNYGTSTDWLIEADKWTHVAAVKSGGRIKAYVNGTLAFDRAIISTSYGNYKNYTTIGGRDDASSSSYLAIDELRISNTARDVSQLWNSGVYKNDLSQDVNTVSLMEFNNNLNEVKEHEVAAVGSFDYILGRNPLIVNPTDTPSPDPTATNTPTPTLTPTPTTTITPTPIRPGYHTVYLTPTDDSYVNNTTNHGKAKQLVVDGAPSTYGYLKFNLTPYAGKKLLKANLAFTVPNALGSDSRANFRIWSTGTSWKETTVNSKNAPNTLSQVASFSQPKVGQTITPQVTSYLASKMGKTVSFAIETLSFDNLILNSKEAQSNPPQLILQYQD